MDEGLDDGVLEPENEQEDVCVRVIEGDDEHVIDVVLLPVKVGVRDMVCVPVIVDVGDTVNDIVGLTEDVPDIVHDAEGDGEGEKLQVEVSDGDDVRVREIDDDVLCVGESEQVAVGVGEGVFVVDSVGDAEVDEEGVYVGDIVKLKE